MGTLVAARLLNDGFDDRGSSIDAGWARKVVKGVYTYGQPMVGDPAFADECARYVAPVLYRHTHRKDVIPHVPVRSILESLPAGARPARALRYVHFGTERHSPTLRGPWTPGSDSKAALVLRAFLDVGINAVAARLFAGAMPVRYSLDDHKPLNYEEISRHSIEPQAAPVTPTWRSVVDVMVPLQLRKTFRAVLAPNGASPRRPPNTTAAG
jgi:hypothetical protein